MLLLLTPGIRPHDNSFAMISLMSTIIPIVITVAILGFVFLRVLLPLMRRQAEAQQLLATGQPAQAKVVVLQDTGTMVNNSPQVRMELEVYPEGGQPYRAQVITIVSHLAIPRVQPGMAVRVRYDRQNPSRIALEL